jgi:hypothetical protein
MEPYILNQWVDEARKLVIIEYTIDGVTVSHRVEMAWDNPGGGEMPSNPLLDVINKANDLEEENTELKTENTKLKNDMLTMSADFQAFMDFYFSMNPEEA